MSPAAVFGLTLLGSYLLGAIPFGYLIARWRGVDILHQGSGNIGATNVGRVLGRRFGILVFVLDFAKGAAPAAAAGRIALGEEPHLTPDLVRAAAGLAAFLGHLFPVYLGFRGGKGVATGAGVISVLLPGPALGALLAWVGVLCATRYVSLASLSAAAVLVLLRFWLTPEPFAPDNQPLTCFCLLAAGLVFLRHRANLHRLLHASENRLQETPAMQLLTRIVHVLALGLWFGSVVFFSLVVGLSLFGTFEALSEKPAGERPFWFPLPPELDRDPPGKQFPSPLRKEQGSRAAGAAVSPMFTWYYGIQLACGILALATAWSWLAHGTVHKVRAALLALALAGAAAGWWLEHRVSELRHERNQASDMVLTDAQPSSEALRAADEARARFGAWHGCSLLVNFATLALVAAAMALAARLPEKAEPIPGEGA